MKIAESNFHFSYLTGGEKGGAAAGFSKQRELDDDDDDDDDNEFCLCSLVGLTKAVLWFS